MDDSPDHRGRLESAPDAAPQARGAPARPTSAAAGAAYKLYLPRPPALPLALWIWLLTSAFLLVVLAVEAYIRVFQIPDGDLERYRFVPGPMGPKEWALTGLALALNLVRLWVMAAALRAPQAATALRAGWIVGIASSLFHVGDYLFGIAESPISGGRIAMTPAPLAAASVLALVLSLLPTAVRWVWVPPEIHVPDWTYSESSDRQQPAAGQGGEESGAAPAPEIPPGQESS